MQIKCSYCQAGMGRKKPFDSDEISHGICDECLAYYSDQFEGLSFDEYLDRFEAPVLIVNNHVRILASNRKVETMIGRSHNKFVGLLGGEALECAYARLPGGCGHTVHCVTCSIRNTVTAVIESGKPQMHVPAKLNQNDQKIAMLISAEKIGPFVLLTIETPH